MTAALRWPRLRTAYALHRTDSGRLASGVDSTEGEKVSKEASQVQNVPKDLRDMFRADPGHAMIACDWAAIEWCICMMLAEDVVGEGFHRGLLDKFQANGFDPHRWLASFAYGVNEAAVTPDQRRHAKPFTFGFMYEGGYGTLADNARVSRAMGKRVADVYEPAFRLKRWQDATVEEAKRQGYVETVGGWRRYSVLDRKEILATRVQGTAADLMKWVMVRMYEGLPEWAEPLTTLHDALLVQVPEERAEEGRAWLVGLMQQPIPWLGGQSFRVEAKVGEDWKKVS